MPYKVRCSWQLIKTILNVYVSVRKETILIDRYERFMKCKTVAVFPNSR